MSANAAPNVWTQMNYVPPRGQCNFKPSYLSARCPCLRFMLHPLKSTSSFECDGCSHHASFHSMENKIEDEIRRKWEQEMKDKQQRDEGVGNRPRKRPREIEFEPTTGYKGGVWADAIAASTTSSPSKTKKANGKAGTLPPAPARGAATRSRGKVTELPDEDYIDLD